MTLLRTRPRRPGKEDFDELVRASKLEENLFLTNDTGKRPCLLYARPSHIAQDFTRTPKFDSFRLSKFFAPLRGRGDHHPPMPHHGDLGFPPPLTFTLAAIQQHVPAPPSKTPTLPRTSTAEDALANAQEARGHPAQTREEVLDSYLNCPRTVNTKRPWYPIISGEDGLEGGAGRHG